MPRHDDPAERTGYLRYFYRGWRPTRIGKSWNRALAWLSGIGLTPQILVTLQVKGRASGRLRTVVLAGVHYQGHLHVVSMLGKDSDWVQNVRAARGEALIKRIGVTPVVLTEIPASERAPILRAWCQVATSGRKHLPVSYDAPLSEFEPIAGDYPVFRIDPAPVAGRRPS